MRDEGWYWILIGDNDEQGTWQVAQWSRSAWWTCGTEREWDEDDQRRFFKQIGERITRDGK